MGLNDTFFGTPGETIVHQTPAMRPPGFGFARDVFGSLGQVAGQPFPIYQGQVDPGLSPTMQNLLRMSQGYAGSQPSQTLAGVQGALGRFMTPNYPSPQQALGIDPNQTVYNGMPASRFLPPLFGPGEPGVPVGGSALGLMGPPPNPGGDPSQPSVFPPGFVPADDTQWMFDQMQRQSGGGLGAPGGGMERMHGGGIMGSAPPSFGTLPLPQGGPSRTSGGGLFGAMPGGGPQLGAPPAQNRGGMARADGGGLRPGGGMQHQSGGGLSSGRPTLNAGTGKPAPSKPQTKPMPRPGRPGQAPTMKPNDMSWLGPLLEALGGMRPTPRPAGTNMERVFG